MWGKVWWEVSVGEGVLVRGVWWEVSVGEGVW